MQIGEAKPNSHPVRDWVKASAAFGETAVCLAKVPLALTALGVQQWQLLFLNPLVANRPRPTSVRQPVSEQTQPNRPVVDASPKAGAAVAARPAPVTPKVAPTPAAPPASAPRAATKQPAAPVSSKPAHPKVATKSAAQTSAKPDDLSQINGVGPAVQTRLNALGVTRFDQIAGWTDADIETMRAQLGRLGLRIKSGDWRGQAQRLIAARTKGSAKT